MTNLTLKVLTQQAEASAKIDKELNLHNVAKLCDILADIVDVNTGEEGEFDADEVAYNMEKVMEEVETLSPLESDLMVILSLFGLKAIERDVYEKQKDKLENELADQLSEMTDEEVIEMIGDDATGLFSKFTEGETADDVDIDRLIETVTDMQKFIEDHDGEIMEPERFSLFATINENNNIERAILISIMGAYETVHKFKRLTKMPTSISYDMGNIKMFLEQIRDGNEDYEHLLSLLSPAEATHIKGTFSMVDKLGEIKPSAKSLLDKIADGVLVDEDTLVDILVDALGI